MISKVNNSIIPAFKATIQLDQPKDEFESNFRKHTEYSSIADVNCFQAILNDLKQEYPKEDTFKLTLKEELGIKYSPGKKSLEEGLKEKALNIKLSPEKGIDSDVITRVRNYFLNRIAKEDSIKRMLSTIG